MAITVGDLVDAPQLGLTLLAGRAGLGGTANWAHTCDLPDPWNWVGDGHVLLTNGPSIPADAAGQKDLLSRLHQAGIAAIGVGADMGAAGLVPDALRLADELGVPVFSVPYPLPFMAIAQTIAEAASAAQARRIQTTVKLYSRLTDASLNSVGLRPFTQAIGRLIGFECVVVDSNCLHPWSPAIDPPSWLKGASPLARRGSDGIASLWENDAGEVLHSLPIQTVPSCMAFFRPRERIEQDTTQLLHAASVLGAFLGQQHHSSVQRNRRAVEFVDRILNEGGRTVGVPDDWTAELGLGRTVRGAVIQGGSADDQDGLVHRLQRHGAGLAATMRDGRLLCILRAGADEDSSDHLVEKIRHCMEGPIQIGLGSEVSSTAIRESLMEGVWALEFAQWHGGEHCSSADLQQTESERNLHVFTPHRTWMGFGRPEQGRAFVHEVFGPLIAKDPAISELRATLAAYLENDRSPQRTATALHLHRQTVNQRLKKIEHALGRELRSTETVAQLWLALRLYRASGGHLFD